MPQTQNDKFIPWAQAALADYGLHAPKVYFLGHSDNITFRVEEAGGAIYLLRLHQPVLPYWAGIRQLPEFIASELTWLEALALEGGFPVQHPIRTQDGQLVTMLKFDHDKPVPATLLTWLEGEHFSPVALAALQQIEQFGALVARMHEFSTHWSPPAGFTRPSYDQDHFHRIFARLLRGADLDIFSEDIYLVLRATCQAVLSEINALSFSHETWGVIHADLHVGNFLVNQNAENAHTDPVIPIDFSFCGFGHYLFDLSVCLAGGLNAALRPAFLHGYRSVRALPESDLRVVDAYALSGMMSYYAYQIDNPAERSWLQRRIPEVVLNECSRFLKGERIV